MITFIEYLLKLSVSLAVVYIFYALVLRRLTFYTWNRWYLLGYSIASFFIPFINISPWLEKNNWNNSAMVTLIPRMSNGGLIQQHESVLTGGDVLLLLFLAGVVIMFVRLLLQYLSLYKVVRSSQLMLHDRVKVYQVNKSIIPFSFGKSIFINQHQHTEEELKEIIRHEFIHVKQQHSIDMLWGEILCVLNWYNPFAWLARKAIRQNLEFIADHQVVENGLDKKQYQYLLLKVIGVSHYSMANNFNFSSLKKRIAMMNKMRSAKVNLLKFLFLLPVIIVLLLAFRNSRQNMPQDSIPAFPEMKQDTVPGSKSQKDVKFPEEILSIGLMHNSDEDENDPVKRKLDGLVAVKRKDGKIEVYDMKSDKSKEEFEKKYGVKLEDLIAPPAPPTPPSPPVPPTPPALPKSMNKVSRIERQDNTVTIKLKDGTNEKYEINNEADRKRFKEKYGVEVEAIIPKAPSPPAPADNSFELNYELKQTKELSEVSDIHIQNELLTLGFPDGKKENYNVNKEEDRQIFEKRYGARLQDFMMRTPVVPEPASVVIAEPAIDVKVSDVPAVTSVAEKAVQAKPLVVIDEVVTVNTNINNIDPYKIESINVLTGKDATDRYGKAGTNGVVKITMKKQPTTTMFLDNFDGVIIVDNKEHTQKSLQQLNLTEAQIESMSVWKGDEAIKKYGDKGKKGVIVITTKKPT